MLMVGCRSDRNLNPSSHTFAQGSYGSLIVMLWLGLCLNYYLVFADACKVCNHKSKLILNLKGVLALIHPPTLIDTIHITWRNMVKVTWLSLPCVLKNALAFISPVPRLILVKGLGHLLLLSYPVYLACLLSFCCLNQKPQNIYLSVFAALSLSSVTCQYLLLLAGIDILIYRKATIDPLDLWVIKNRLLARLTGEAIPLNLLTSPPSTSFSSAVAGECSAIGK